MKWRSDMENAPRDRSFWGWHESWFEPEICRREHDSFMPRSAIEELRQTGAASYHPPSHWRPRDDVPFPPEEGQNFAGEAADKIEDYERDLDEMEARLAVKDAALRKARGALDEVLTAISEGRVSYGEDLGGSVRRAREALTDPALEVAAAEAAVVEAAEDWFKWAVPDREPSVKLGRTIIALRAAREK